MYIPAEAPTRRTKKRRDAGNVIMATLHLPLCQLKPVKPCFSIYIPLDAFYLILTDDTCGFF